MDNDKFLWARLISRLVFQVILIVITAMCFYLVGFNAGVDKVLNKWKDSECTVQQEIDMGKRNLEKLR